MTISIRRASTRDAAAFARMMGDPAVFAGLMQMPFPDEELWRTRLADNFAPGKIDLPLVAEINGEVVGSSGLHPAGLSLRRRHALTLGLSVVPGAQGQGVGSALMAAMCDYADNWFAALRLELTVYSDNVVAIHLYRKFGFEIEGTLKAYAMRNGGYVDAHAMARFHPRPPQISLP
ncbi:MAG: GNAT family N-acetyltransferase [Rhizobacter sp.]|nr:GNAT family N-acetyltransferase [Rhizobacter sp.]